MKKKIIHHAKKTHKKIQLRRRGESNLNLFLTFAAFVMIWRGIWMLLDMYIFPSKLFLSAILPIIFAIIYFLIDDRKLKELIKS